MSASVHAFARYPLTPSTLGVLIAREERLPCSPTRSSYRSDGPGPGPAPRCDAAPGTEADRVLDWRLVHARIVLLGRERAMHERELGRWLRAAERLAVHVRAGYASLGEYVERVVGLDRRALEERLRVARALSRLPRLDEALGKGELCWSAVRELSRVATRETEEEWLEWAKGKRSRQIEQAVAKRAPGARPEDRGDERLVKHHLRFEVCAETIALFRDLCAQIRNDLGGRVDDDTLLYEMARRALGGPGSEGRASYQVAVTRCPECMRTSIDAAGESHVVDRSMAEMVACDCQEVGRLDAALDTSPHAGAAKQNGPSDQGPDDAVPSAPSPALRQRATQTIAPATRRKVLRRDHRRCVVPGCRNHRFLDLHHIVLRSDGGQHDPETMATLCGAHHRAVHAGTLSVSGSVSKGLRFRHADGASYGAPLRPAPLDVAAQVLGALRGLGFSESQARARMDAVAREGAPDRAAGLRIEFQ